VSFKLKISVLVALFVLVAILIGITGIAAVRIQSKALTHSVEFAEHFARLQALSFDIEEVSAILRGMLLTDETPQKVSMSDEIISIVTNRINPIMSGYVPLPEEKERWTQLVGIWDEYQKHGWDIVEKSRANTGYYARKLSTGSSLNYWISYEEPLRELVKQSQESDHYLSKDILYEAMSALESLKSLQLYEKLAVSSVEEDETKAFIQKGVEDRKRFSSSLDAIEKLILNLTVSDEEFKQFNDAFNKASAGKIKFTDYGTASWDVTNFTLPPNFITRSLEKISTYYWKTIKPMRGGGTEIFNKVTQAALTDTNKEAVHIFNEICFPMDVKMMEIIVSLLEDGQRSLDLVRQESEQATVMALRFLYLIIIIGLIVGIGMAVFFTTKLNSTLKEITTELGEISAQIETATGQLTTAADSLAQGASEHAASLHDTRETLEDLSDEIDKSLNNAKSADKVMREATSEVEIAEDSMRKANSAMGEIASSGNKIEKILKTINGIAFQTNLLALNAAVEASRAGEAGAGFAIVAEEVRNLAVRSSEAAKDSADLIFQMIHNIEMGTTLVNTTTKQLENTSESISKASLLFTEISEGAKAQYKHVEGIHDAVVQMDTVIQANAAAAEELAGSVGGLSQQVTVLREDMGDLIDLTEGVKKVKHQTVEANEDLAYEY
jgi:methyl-accepting chemotaxis protein